jgi:hypothetical protein
MEMTALTKLMNTNYRDKMIAYMILENLLIAEKNGR